MLARAIETEAATDVKRKHDAVAGFDLGDGVAHGFDDTHVFVAENRSGLARRATLVHVEIAAADRGGGEANDGVGGRFDRRVVDVLDGDGVRLLPDECAHECPRDAMSVVPGLLPAATRGETRSTDPCPTAFVVRRTAEQGSCRCG
jgi:hypothetical protein